VTKWSINNTGYLGINSLLYTYSQSHGQYLNGYMRRYVLLVDMHRTSLGVTSHLVKLV
jgi:hypothetical protein